MFDCGEGTQIQCQRSSVRPGRFTRIFITHLHGDHLFGLPGFMCLVQGNVTGAATSSEPMELYGPVGLGQYLRTCLSLSGTDLIRPYVVHEIDIEDNYTAKQIEASELSRQEVPGTIIKRRSDGSFLLFETSDYKVEAGILSHRLPCVGFVVTEAPTVGTLDAAKLKELGVPPGPLYGKLKSGQSIAAPDGSVVTPDMVIGENKRGRKVVILGDTCDNTQIESLSRGADVVVHEATHQDELVEKALECGHSTPSMAAMFCQKVGTRTLVLTHFSQRYKDDDIHEDVEDEIIRRSELESVESEADVKTSYLVNQALRDGLNVIAAKDFFTFVISR